MTEQHPISPPQELVIQWCHEAAPGTALTEHLLICAVQWGWDQREPELQERADQELEACCEWLDLYGMPSASDALRAARRPKPPSLKQEALDALSLLCEGPNPTAFVECKDTIRRALESLPNE